MAHILTAVHGHVLVIMLNRPEARNAFEGPIAARARSALP